MNSKEELEKLLERRKYLEEWLANNKVAQQALPAVQSELDKTNLSIKTLNNLPEEAEEIPREDLLPSLSKENEIIKSSFPMIPSFDTRVLYQPTYSTTSGSTSILNVYVGRIGEINTLNAQRFAEDYFDVYHVMQSSESRLTVTKQLLTQFQDDEILERFDIAYNAFIGVKSGTINQNGAASEIRTLLYKLNGRLFELARKFPKENMTWDRMAHRLASNNQTREILLDKKRIQLYLTDQLSNIVKARNEQITNTVERMWPLTLDHIYIIVSSVKFPRENATSG